MAITTTERRLNVGLTPEEVRKKTGFRKLVGKYETGKPVSFTGQNILRRIGAMDPNIPVQDIQTPNLLKQTQEIIANRRAAQGLGGIEQAGQEAARRLSNVPGLIAQTPGIERFTGTQRGQLADIRRGGLQSLFSGLRGLSEEKEAAKKETKELQETLKRNREGKLEARQQSAMDEFLSLRRAIAAKGLSLDPTAGAKFLKAIRTSSDPEVELDKYVATAFNVPAVKAAFAPKPVARGGGGGGGSAKADSYFTRPKPDGSIGFYFGNSKSPEEAQELTSEQYLEGTSKAAGVLSDDEGYGEDFMSEVKAMIDFDLKNEGEDGDVSNIRETLIADARSSGWPQSVLDEALVYLETKGAERDQKEQGFFKFGKFRGKG